MRIYCAILAIQLIEVYSATKISLLNDYEPLTVAAVNIVDRCFGLSEHWSELLITYEHHAREILQKIHHKSKTSISFVSFANTERSQFTHSGKCNSHSNTKVEWQKTKPMAVIIIIHSPKQLQSILSSLKYDTQRIWRPRSYFLIVLETGCNSDECNKLFKTIWDYWILDAVILCSSSNPADRNYSEIELYTFNPYSVDHSPQWETIIHETIEVFIHPGKFNHAWYIFKQRFTEIVSAENCRHLFFDKTSNLDGYLIPVSMNYFGSSSNVSDSWIVAWFKADNRTVTALAKKLRFDVAQVFYNGLEDHGSLLRNGSYVGLMDDLCNGRLHIAPHKRGVRSYPGLEITYPHDVSGACLASWITGNRPQWTNLADAKHIWIALGLGLLFSTAVLYLQNKSHGIVSAFLDAERLIFGSSIIRGSTLIKHRLILGSIFLVVLVVDGVIRVVLGVAGRFISILTVARPYPNLDTLEQIREQDIAVYGQVLFKDIMTDPQIRARFNTSLIFPKCLDRLQSRENQRACFADCQMLRFSTMNASDIHIAPTPIWTTYVAFVTTLHWPMTDRYSFEVQKLLEAGIFQKWNLDVDRKLEVNAWKLKRVEQSSFVRPIKVNDLLPAFVLLLLGLSAALLVFIWEMKGFAYIKS